MSGEPKSQVCQPTPHHVVTAYNAFYNGMVTMYYWIANREMVCYLGIVFWPGHLICSNIHVRLTSEDTYP